MNIDKVIDYIQKQYLPRARWWPWKEITKRIEVLDYAYTDKLIFLIFKADDLFFQLPLMRVSQVPGHLHTRGFCLNSDCFIEAEYSEKYLREVSRIKQLRYYPIHGRLEELEVYEVTPLTLESTNSVALYKSNLGILVYKSYRLLPEINIEVKMLDRLSRARFRHIPKILGFTYYENKPSGILMEYVKGFADGGAPFYKSLISYISGSGGFESIGLAARLGIVISEMHIALNQDATDSFFGVEPISDIDISKYMERINRMYDLGLKRLDEVVSELEAGERAELEYWRGICQRALPVIDEAVTIIDQTARELLKARIHQDLHLAQMIYTSNGFIDFVITDFEGEPGRTREERLLKEPVLRDIASMIRSFHYLSHAALMDSQRLGRHEASCIMMEKDITYPWRLRHVVAMTYSYVARMYGSGILGTEENKILRRIWYYTYPWIVERAVYEFYYESLYRPLWVSIPITGIIESKKYLSIKD